MIHAYEFIMGNDQQPDYEVRLALLENDFPNAQWSPVTRQLMLDGGIEMGQRNGERPYHDGLHPIDATRNALQELEERADILEYDLTSFDYEVTGIAGIHHDMDVEAEGEGTPEQRSAELIKAKMRALEYPPSQIERVGNMVIATTAQYVGDKVLQPMAMKVPKDFCVPSLLYGDVGDVLHTSWPHILLTAGKLAAEELYKLKIGDDPLKKVMGIFDKQETFSDQRFEDWPAIVRYHCGDDAGEKYLEATKDRQTVQKNILTSEYLARLGKIRDGLVKACPPIIESTVMSYHEKSDAFFRAAMTLINKKLD